MIVLNKVLDKLVGEDAGTGLLAVRGSFQKLCRRLGKNAVFDVGLLSGSGSLELSLWKRNLEVTHTSVDLMDRLYDLVLC